MENEFKNEISRREFPEKGALADLILVNGNPLENLDLVADPANNFVIIIKDGKIYKNTITN